MLKGGLSMFVNIVAFLALVRDFAMCIFLLVTIAILNTVEFDNRVIVGDFAFIQLAVVDFFTDDGTDCI